MLVLMTPWVKASPPKADEVPELTVHDRSSCLGVDLHPDCSLSRPLSGTRCAPIPAAPKPSKLASSLLFITSIAQTGDLRGGQVLHPHVMQVADVGWRHAVVAQNGNVRDGKAVTQRSDGL